MRIALSIVLLSLTGCSTAASTKSEESAKPSSAGSSKPTATGEAAKPAATEDVLAVAGPPADPLDDSGKVQASCDNGNICTEHYNLGLGEESAQKICESNGKWAKAGGCRKDGRAGVCRTSTDRMIYYKGDAATAKLCVDMLNGKWADFPKGK